KRVFLPGSMFPDEDLRLIERAADDECHHRRQQPEKEHTPPAHHGKQERSNQRSQQNSNVPPEPHIGRNAHALAGWPSLGCQSQPEAKSAAQPKTRKCPIADETPVPLRKAEKAGERRKNKNGPGQSPNAAKVVAHAPKNGSARHGPEQSPGDE